MQFTKAMMGMMMGMQAAMGGGEAAADATPTIKSEDKHAAWHKQFEEYWRKSLFLMCQTCRLR